MAKALVTASEAPLSMMELILEAMKLIDRISVIGSRIAISDAGVGITMCEAEETFGRVMDAVRP